MNTIGQQQCKKFSMSYAQIAYVRSRGMAPTIPNFGARREWSTSSSGRFTCRKRTRVPSSTKLHYTQQHVCTLWRK